MTYLYAYVCIYWYIKWYYHFEKFLLNYSMCSAALSHSVMSDSLRTMDYMGFQASLSMEFSREEYWGGWPFPSPGDLPDPGIKPGSFAFRQILYQLSDQGSPKCSISTHTHTHTHTHTIKLQINEFPQNDQTFWTNFTSKSLTQKQEKHMQNLITKWYLEMSNKEIFFF